MIEHKHTPGPWEINKYGQVVDKAGEEVRVHGFTLASRKNETTEANTRLAVAAPELLDALAYIVAMGGTEENEWDAVERVIPEICAKARAAIAKATGEQE